MTVLAKCFVETIAMPAAETSYYPAPANTRSIIDKMTITNTTGAALTVIVRLIPNGSAAAGGFAVINSVNVASNSAYTCPEIAGHVLNPGDFISALPSAVGLNLRVSGREVS